MPRRDSNSIGDGSGCEQLTAAYETRYEKQLRTKLQFFCKDCSKTLNPQWIMADFFSYPEYEVGTPFNAKYCGCYKHNRSWSRSVLARIT